MDNEVKETGEESSGRGTLPESPQNLSNLVGRLEKNIKSVYDKLQVGITEKEEASKDAVSDKVSSLMKRVRRMNTMMMRIEDKVSML